MKNDYLGKMGQNMWTPQSFDDDNNAFAYVEFAKKSNEGSVSETDWHRYFEKSLYDIIHYVKEHSPFYRDTLSAFNAEAISIGNLDKLPFTTKNDMQTYEVSLLSKPIRSGTIYYETSGSTSKPTPSPRTWFEAFASNYHFSRNMDHLRWTHPCCPHL